MKLTLKRTEKAGKYTAGKLYVDGVPFCDTVEDTDRGLDDSMPLDRIRSLKVYGETAIPRGTYKVDMHTVSYKFKGKPWCAKYSGIVPRLVNVKGYDGVLIHPGNTNADTLGCILVGEAEGRGVVSQSVKTFDRLMQRLLNDSDNVELTIE